MKIKMLPINGEPNKSNTHNTTLFALILTVFTLIVVSLPLGLIPNELDVNYIQQNFVHDVYNFQPERPETARFIVLAILFPFCFAIYYFLLSRYDFYKAFQSICLALLIPFTIFILLINPFFSHRIPSLIIRSHTHFFILLGIITLIIIGLFKIKENIALYPVIKASLLTISIIIVFFKGWLWYYPDYFAGNDIHHFYVYFYPVHRVFGGQTLIVDFNSIYGFYPYILAPLFILFNRIGQASFSIVMSFLMVISSFAVMIALWLHLKNKYIAFIGSTATFFFCGILLLIAREGFYFLQYYPHRYVFPALSILLCVLRNRAHLGKFLLIWRTVSFLFGIIAIIWNFDTGFIVIFAIAAFEAYHDLYELYNNTYKSIQTYLLLKLGRIFLIVFLQIMVAILFIIGLTYLRSGVLVSLTDLFFGQIIFFGTGFFMVPMTLWHPWLILALIYSIGLATSIRALPIFYAKHNRQTLSKMSMFFYISVLGIGIFTYYLGRSHDLLFITIMYPGVILLTLLLDNYTSMFHGKKDMLLRAKQIVITIFLSFSIGLFVLTAFDDNILQSNKARANYYDSYLETVTQFIHDVRENYCGPLDIIARHSSMVYLEIGEPNITPISDFYDIFLIDQVREITDYLSVTKRSFVICSAYLRLLIDFDYVRFNNVVYNRFDDVEFFAGGGRGYRLYRINQNSLSSFGYDALSLPQINISAFTATQSPYKTYAIDIVSEQGDFLIIAGWAFIKGLDTDDQQIYVIINDNKGRDIAVYRAYTHKREDLADLFSNNLYLNSGFRAIIPLSEIPYGEIYISINVYNDGELFSFDDSLLYVLLD